MMLSAEQLLAGQALTHEVAIPPALLAEGGDGRVVLRPLTVRDLQRITNAARDDATLSAALMIQQAMVEPALSLDGASQLSAGVARFLLERIDAISGIDTPGDALTELVQAPLARACFVLAKEFGWTPQDVSGMTIGQILLYVQMVHDGTEAA